MTWRWWLERKRLQQSAPKKACDASSAEGLWRGLDDPGSKFNTDFLTSWAPWAPEPQTVESLNLLLGPPGRPRAARGAAPRAQRQGAQPEAGPPRREI